MSYLHYDSKKNFKNELVYELRFTILEKKDFSFLKEALLLFRPRPGCWRCFTIILATVHIGIWRSLDKWFVWKGKRRLVGNASMLSGSCMVCKEGEGEVRSSGKYLYMTKKVKRLGI